MRRFALAILLSFTLAASAARAGTPAAVAGPTALSADLPLDVESEVEQARLRQVIDRCVQAYLFIDGGSGSIISPDGYVLTNNHVVSLSRTWRVKNVAGRTFTAEVVGAAPGTDLAILKIRDPGAKNLPFLPLGDSDKLAVGEQVVAIGNPFGLGSTDHTPTVTVGVVSAVEVNGPAVGDTIATDTPINPGNSGGPLINQAGELVGVNYGQMPSRFGLRINTGSGFAVSVNQVKRFLDPLKKARGGQVAVGAINGIKLAGDEELWVAATAPDDNEPLREAVVRAVEPDSPADRAGIRPGDRITAVGPWAVISPEQMLALAARYPAGVETSITVARSASPGQARSATESSGQARRNSTELAEGPRPQRVELIAALEPQERVGLGLSLESRSNRSLKVERVLPGGPAHLAGVKPGDVIRAIGPLSVLSRSMLATVLTRVRPGQTLPVTVVRAGRSVTLTVELAGAAELARLTRVAATQPDPFAELKTGPAATTQPAERPATQPARAESATTRPDSRATTPSGGV